jgi:hypothetical protein
VAEDGVGDGGDHCHHLPPVWASSKGCRTEEPGEADHQRPLLPAGEGARGADPEETRDGGWAALVGIDDEADSPAGRALPLLWLLPSAGGYGLFEPALAPEIRSFIEENLKKLERKQCGQRPRRPGRGCEAM